MPNSSPFLLTDLPRGWSVTWPGFDMVVADTPQKIRTLLDILFRDLGQWHAELGVILQDREFSTYSISATEWYRPGDHRFMLCEHIARTFKVSGVRFDQLEPAELFLTHMEQRLAWRRLGGQWS